VPYTNRPLLMCPTRIGRSLCALHESAAPYVSYTNRPLLMCEVVISFAEHETHM
jgi:hypothetical protein